MPSYTTLVGDFGDEKVFLLQDGTPPEQDFLYENFSISPSASVYSQTEISETSSRYKSDHCDEIYQKDKSVCDEFSYIVTNTGDVQTGFDINMDDTKNIPESIYPVEVQEKVPVFINNQTSVIVKSNSGEIFNSEPSNTTNRSVNESNTTILTGYINMHGNTFENENMNNTTTSDGDDKSMIRDNDDDEEMRKGFDIETLVEECFMQMHEGS